MSERRGRGLGRWLRFGISLGISLGMSLTPARAATLAGTVTARGEPALEGVLVTVRRLGSPIATTVVSDAAGHYAFPDGRLEPGRYTLAVRAVGFELAAPSTFELKAGGSRVRVHLHRTAELASQLTNSEWLASLPGTAEDKRQLSACATCHPLTVPLESGYNAAQLRERIAWMAGMSSQAMPGLVQRKAVPDPPSSFGDVDRLAQYIASLNRSSETHSKLSLRGFERPHGAATRVVITSYDLPRRTMQPHDAVRGDDGYVWISNFGENSLLRLDPQSGAVREYPYAPTRPGPYANGNLDLEFDPQGGLWLAMMNQTGIARFDRRSGEFSFHPIPETLRDESTQTSMVEPVHSAVDGKIWVQAVLKPQITRFDTGTGRYEDWTRPFEGLPGFHAAYGVYSDSANNAYLCDYQSRFIVQIDARTGKVRYFATPTDHSRPRRGRMDRLDRLWFAEWAADRIAMFDTRSGAFTEWTVPGFMPEPYDAELDGEGWVWTDNMMDDRLTRLDPKTGRTIQYLLPIPTNARRVSVDNSGARPVLWVGANHEAAVLKVEPLDAPESLASLGAPSWPEHYALRGTRSERQYVYAVSLQRDGDDFVLAGGAPTGEAGARITVHVDARGGIAGTDASGRFVDCGAEAGKPCALPLHGFLAAAATVAALRRGITPPLVAVGRFAGRRIACVDAAALEGFAGDGPPVVDPCLDTATGAVLAFRHRRSGNYEGASLDPESIRLRVGRASAASPARQAVRPS